MTTQTPFTLDNVLTAASAQASNAQAETVAKEYFGQIGTARLLAGERDLNFHLLCHNGTQFLLKLSHPAEDPAVIDLQNKALLHIQQTDPNLPVQRIYVSKSGAYQVPIILNGQTVLARLFSFAQGTPLNQIEHPDASLRISLGEHLARLDLALRDFFHPAAGHELLWDIKHSSRLNGLLQYIENEQNQALARHFLNNFEQYALPQLNALRAQIIHNDLNFHNVIVEESAPHAIRNIVDFGDIVHAPLINDLAVAAAYQLGDGSDPLAQALPFIGAYHQLCPLQEMEQAILFDLITTRLVMTAVITNWRAALYPDNRDYILRNASSAWNALRGLKQLSRESAQVRIRDICTQEIL